MSSRSSSVESLDRQIENPQERAEFFGRLEVLLQQKDPIVIYSEQESFYDFLNNRFSGNENSELAVFPIAKDEDDMSKRVRLEIWQLLESYNFASRLSALENDGLNFYSLCESLHRSDWTNEIEVGRIQQAYDTSIDKWTTNFKNFNKRLEVIDKRYTGLYHIASHNIDLLNEQCSTLSIGIQMDFEKYQLLAPTLQFLDESNVQLMEIMDRCNNHGALLTISDIDIRSARVVAPELRTSAELIDKIRLFRGTLCEAGGMLHNMDINGNYASSYRYTALAYLKFMENKLVCLLTHVKEILEERGDEIEMANAAQVNALKTDKIEGFSMDLLQFRSLSQKYNFSFCALHA
ncbi:hypothetical protein CAEBREN_13367 [Caenorhabditis brenneri]|uniref:Uncharacterized protein n=1 Tax=Caenorhabditis brenneri TaxID=135651 RepID=G0MQP9_CAEBE|nr:hypothetical protein CAEBREN_13367 [Caenorhabditis brenneri]